MGDDLVVASYKFPIFHVPEGLQGILSMLKSAEVQALAYMAFVSICKFTRALWQSYSLTQPFPDIFDHGSLISHKGLIFFRIDVGSLTLINIYVQDGLEGVN